MICQELKQIFPLIIIFFVTSCTAPVGLRRTPLDKWETKKFNSLGFEVEVPEQPFNLFRKYYSTVYDTDLFESQNEHKIAYILLHPIWSGSMMVEPMNLLKVFFIKMNASSFEKFNNDEHQANYFWCHKKLDFCSEIIQIEHEAPFGPADGKYLYFRKDSKLINGDILVSIAHLLTNFDEQTKENQEEDIKAIKRILNSVRSVSIENASDNK